MKPILLFLALVFGIIQGVHAQNSMEMLLYPDGAKDSNGLSGEPVALNNGRDVKDVAAPRMFVHLPEKSKATGQVVVVCPGGGYSALAISHEGTQVAKWLNDNGIAAVIVWYRMPNGNREIPLNDVHRAIEITRKNAAKWGINPDQLGIMGFSAGGHLASTASTKFTETTRPNFSILIYPVITMGENTHVGSKNSLLGTNQTEELIKLYSSELQVTAQTPPTFLALSDDDLVVLPINATEYYNALKRAGVAGELHIYPKGAHGWGFNEDWAYKDEFRRSLLRWLGEQNKK